MKKILFLIMLLPSIVLAQTDKQLEFEVSEQPVVNRQTPESAYYYFRTGYSVGSIGQEKGTFTLSAIGTRRYADEFYYGVEYTSQYGLEGLQTYTLSANLGLHLLTLRHRIKPYFGGGFGYVSMTDRGDLNRAPASGISLNADIGCEVFRLNFLSINQGLRIYHNFLNKKEYDTSSFQELYLQLNLRF